MIDLENIKQLALSKFRKVGIGINIQDSIDSVILSIELNLGDIIVLKSYVITNNGCVNLPKYSNVILQETDILTHIYNDIRRLELGLSKFSNK